MKYFAIAAGVFGLCILTFWFVYVRAPSPEEVCKHKIDLVMTEAKPGVDASALVETLQESCVKAARQKIQLRGKIKYANYARCVAEATTLTAAETCSTGS
jgi:hypothetical protein